MATRQTPSKQKRTTKKSTQPEPAKPTIAKKARATKRGQKPQPSGQRTDQTDQDDFGTVLAEYDILLSALPHPVFLLNADHQFVYASDAAEVFFETSTALLKRLKLSDIVSFSNPLQTLVNQVRDTGTTVNEYSVAITTKRFETPKLVDLYAAPVPEKPGMIVVMLLQRAMAQKIERQLTHRAAARSISGMAAVLAHEIKNPLSGIRGAAQLLEDNLSDEDRALSRLICTETDRIKTLVDRMEVFGDERPITKSSVNIHDVIDHVNSLAKAGFAQGVTIQENYDPSLPPVPGDRDLLVQAFLNLIKNACEALHGDRSSDRITIHTAFRPGVSMLVPGVTTKIALPLMIQIEDNGRGIPDHLKTHLFDPFVTTKTGGTGLGLALVAKIIGDHGGTIECESDNNRTIFRVMLPLEAAPGKRRPNTPTRDTIVTERANDNRGP